MKTGLALSLIIIVILASCVSDSAVDVEDLYGDWEVIAAKRNLKLTSTLKNGYFTFVEDGVMKTNIFGREQVFNIQVTPEEIIQLGDDKTVYKIRKLDNDTLHISSTIQKYYFDFLAVKRDSLPF